MARNKSQGKNPHTLPIVPLESSRALYELADEYVRIKPWETIGNADFFNVIDENSGLSGWAVVLGHAGEVFGLALYQGLLGLSQLQCLFETEDGIPAQGFDYVASLDFLNYNWVPGPELDEIDTEVLKLVGRRTKGQERYHQFQSYRPGYVAWALDKHETEFLGLGMQAALALRQALAKGINPFVDGFAPSFKFTKQGKLEMGLVKPEPYQAPELDPPHLAPAASEVIRTIPHSGTWQAGHFFAHGQVMDAERPYHLHMLAFVEDGSGYAFPPNAFGPLDNVAQAFINQFAEVVAGEKTAPETIEISDRQLLRAVAPQLSQLGVMAVYRPELPGLKELADTFREYLVKNPMK